MSEYIGYTPYQPGLKALASDILFGAIIMGAVDRWGGRAALLLTNLSKEAGEAYASVGVAVGASVFTVAQALGEAVMPDSTKSFVKCASLVVAVAASHEAGKAAVRAITGEGVTFDDGSKITASIMCIAATVLKIAR